MTASRRASRRSEFWWFLGVVLLVNAIAAELPTMNISDQRRHAVEVGLFFDFLITIPLAYYWFVLRDTGRAWMTYWFVAGLGALRAATLLIRDSPARITLLVTIDLGVVIAVLWRARTSWRVASEAGLCDPLDHLTAAVAGIIPSRFAARAFATELAIAFYAFTPARPTREIPQNAKRFTAHEQSGASLLLYVLAVLSFFEAAVMHLVLKRWTATGAWILTAISIYGALWLLALTRSLPRRPLLVRPDGLTIQWGFLWRIDAPNSAIDSIEQTSHPPKRRTPGYLRLAPLSDSTCLIRLHAPLIADGPFGIQERVSLIGIAPDNLDAFLAAVAKTSASL